MATPSPPVGGLCSSRSPAPPVAYTAARLGTPLLTTRTLQDDGRSSPGRCASHGNDRDVDPGSVSVACHPSRADPWNPTPRDRPRGPTPATAAPAAGPPPCGAGVAGSSRPRRRWLSSWPRGDCTAADRCDDELTRDAEVLVDDDVWSRSAGRHPPAGRRPFPAPVVVTRVQDGDVRPYRLRPNRERLPHGASDRAGHWRFSERAGVRDGRRRLPTVGGPGDRGHLRVANSLTRDPGEAEDRIQDALIRAYAPSKDSTGSTPEPGSSPSSATRT